MKDINPVALIPVGVFSFLGGMLLSRSSNPTVLTPSKAGALSGVPTASWSRFITVMAVAPKKHVTPRGRMGTFGIDARRLADVGFMEKPKKVTIGSETGVWSGDWKSPLTTENFLASTPAQYEAFKRSMKLLAPKVGSFIGADIDGEKASLSGLLGVGHLAGEAGVASWVKDPEVRKKFRNTTANFKRTNNIF
jgi:hypothetical protein